MTLLMLIHDSIYSEFKSLGNLVFTEQIIRILCQLLKEQQIQSLLDWPNTYGGGMQCVNMISS